MINQSSHINKVIKLRASLVYLLMILMGLAVVVQMIILKVVQHDKWQSIYEDLTIHKTIQPKRGDIFSADGKLMATSIPYYDVTIDLRTKGWDRFFKNGIHVSKTNQLILDSICTGIHQFIPSKSKWIIKSELRNRYNSKNQFYFPEPLNFVQWQYLKSLPFFRESRYICGLVFDLRNNRVKPYGNLCSRTVGNVNKDGKGTVGLEAAFDKELKGVQTETVLQKMAGGYWIPIDQDIQIETSCGDDIVSTIRVDYQDFAHEALYNQLVKTKAHSGCVVLMEVKTGNVLAISNLMDTLGDYREYYNFAVGQANDPGSTMKLPSLLAAFEDGLLDLDDSVDTQGGKFKYAGITISDSHKGGYGKISLLEAFKVSSNVGVSKLILRAYENQPERFIKRLNQFHLSERLNISIPGERTPLLKNPDHELWWKGSLAQMSYGYEIDLTPLQILAFYNAIANRGTLVRPKFVKAIKHNGKIDHRFGTEVIDNSICSRSTLKKARTLLESVVDDGIEILPDGSKIKHKFRGTAWNIDDGNISIAGKTGTAQIAHGNKGYDSQGRVYYRASFVGYFPAENPKYSCIVVIEKPSRSGYYGNIIAAPVFKELADKVVAMDFELSSKEKINKSEKWSVPVSNNGYKSELCEVFDEMDIPYNDDGIHSDWVLSYCKDSVVSLKNRIIPSSAQVPNVIGMGLKDAIYLLENKGLKVKFSGMGAVKKQSLKPGQAIRKGQTIYLSLS